MENMPQYLPIATTFLGGILAISGGLVSGFLIHKHSEKREKNKIIREKCEEIYRMILILDHHTQFICNAIKGNEVEKDAPKEVSLYKQLDMLIYLYFPDLKTHILKYNEARDGIMIRYGSCLYLKNEGKNYISEDTLDYIEIMLRKYKECTKMLKEELHNSFPI